MKQKHEKQNLTNHAAGIRKKKTDNGSCVVARGTQKKKKGKVRSVRKGTKRERN
jgi:hypothetical protein